MKYRVKFSKTGPIKYIGHLDVMRYFQKAIRRANIPIAYSQGFSPHQILSFAFPLSVGFTSEGEYFDMDLTEEVNEKDLKDSFNKVLNEGISVLDVKMLPEKSANCMASVFAAKYKATIKERVELPEDFESKFVDYFSQLTIPVNKPKKKGGGFIDIDLKDYLYDYQISGSDCYFTVNASSSGNIKPSFVMECYFDFLGIEFKDIDINIHRIDLLTNTGLDKEIKLISLMEV